MSTAKNNKKMRKRGADLINAAKDVPCRDCGIKYPPYVMDFDHVRGIKVDNISQMKNAHPDILKEEMAKCEVVCANCHRKRTWFRSVKNFE